MKKFFQEFKAFISKGSVIDMAVGVVIGAAFQGIIKSLVDDVIMPFISLITGKLDFSSMVLPLADVPEGVARTATALKEAGIPAFCYGNFISAVIYFLILAFVVLLFWKNSYVFTQKQEKGSVLHFLFVFRYKYIYNCAHN